MGGQAAALSPYQEVKSSTELKPKYEALLGFNKDSPEYSPFKALSRQAGAQAKMIEGMTSRPSWSSMYEAYGVAPGTDLTPYIQATRQGTSMPMAPIPQSPAAGDIPEFVPPSEEAPKKEAAQGGLMSLRKGYATGGKPKAPKEVTWSAAQETRRNELTAKQQGDQKLTQQERNVLNSLNRNYKGYQTYTDYQAQQAKQTADSSAPPTVPLSQAMNVVTPFYDPNQAQGQYGGVTNPIYQQALDQLRAVSKTPEQYAQATGIMSGAADKLMGMANYTPEQVQASQIARGDIRDAAAQQAQVERMQGGPNVSAVKTRAARMAGPESWTTPGTSQQYMSPYMQNVVDIQKREADRDFSKQMARLDAQAVGAGAYGGSRSALERSEARRAQAQRLGDIEAQGLQQAYQFGMGQFSAEQGQGLQAGQANLGAQMQANLANQQAGMTAQQLNQLYGQGGFQAQAANQAAQNAAYNNYVQQQLTAQGMNQGMDYNTASQNAQLQQQAAIQNQQAGLTAQGLNLQALNQAGQMGQGIGALGTSMWNQQQNIPQMWGAAGQTVQNLAQQAATGAQQTAQNWWGGMGNAYNPSTQLILGAAGQQGTKTTSQIPG